MKGSVLHFNKIEFIIDQVMIKLGLIVLDQKKMFKIVNINITIMQLLSPLEYNWIPFNLNFGWILPNGFGEQI